MPRKSKVDILAEKAAAGDIEALKELATLAKPKPKPKKKASNVQRKKKTQIQVVEALPEDTEPAEPEPQIVHRRATSNIHVIQQRRADKVREIQTTQHAGTKPAKFAPFQVKERKNRFDVDKAFVVLKKKHLNEVKIHEGTQGVERTRDPVEYIEIQCVYCKRDFVIPSNFPITSEDGGYYCNDCAANAKR